MVNYLFLALTSGLLIGYKVDLKKRWEHMVAQLFNLGFVALLAALGAKMAASPEVVLNLGSIGLSAVFLSLMTSIGAALFTYLVLQLKKMEQNENLGAEEVGLATERDKVAQSSFKMAAIPVMALAAGGIFGYFTKNSFRPDYDFWVMFFLNILILGIGIDLGKSRQGWSHIKEMGWMSLLVPLSSLAGSVCGGIAGGLFLGLPLPVFLAIGAGSGFYTVTGPLVTEVAGAKFGALALLANFFREILTIVLVPLVALRFKNFSLIASGGATTMDTTLPVYAQALGPKAAVLALIHGILLTFTVPVLIPLLLKL